MRSGERLEVGVGEEVVDRDRAGGRRASGRTGRRGATGAGRRRRQPNRVASASSSSRLPRRERLGGRAVDVGERGEQAVLVELAGGEREREVVAVAEVRGRPGCAAGRARGPGRRPRDRSASRPPTPRGARRRRRWCGGSRRCRCRRRGGRRSSPRKLLNVDSTCGLELDDLAGGASARTWWGTNASCSRSSWRGEERVGAGDALAGRLRPRRTARDRRGARGGRARPRCAARRPPARSSVFDFPPRLAELELERAEPRLEVGDEGLGRAHGRGVYGERACSCRAGRRPVVSTFVAAPDQDPCRGRSGARRGALATRGRCSGRDRARRLPRVAPRRPRPDVRGVRGALAVVGRRPERVLDVDRRLDGHTVEGRARGDAPLARDAGCAVVRRRAAQLRGARAPIGRDAARRDRRRRAQPDARRRSRSSWGELADAVARCRRGLQALGVGRGDRVVAYAPNIPETLVAFLATASLGAIWSSCAPEFGTRAVVDRFAQIEPVVLVAIDGYRYGARVVDRRAEVAEIEAALPTLRAHRARPVRRRRCAAGDRRATRRVGRAARRAGTARVRRGAVRPPALRALQLGHDRAAQGDRPRPRRHHLGAPEVAAAPPRPRRRRSLRLVHHDRLDDVEPA